MTSPPPGAGTDTPLLAGRDTISTTAYVAITADRGLCGGYNAGVQRATEGEVKADVLNGKQYRIVPIGRKGTGYFHFRGYELGESFTGFSDTPRLEDAKRIAQYVIDQFTSGAVDKVELVYTRFISAGNQEVVLRPLVPLSVETVAGGDGRGRSSAIRRPARQMRPMATTSTSPIRRRSSTPCCRATSRLGSTPPAQRRSVRTRLPSAGDESRPPTTPKS